MQYFKRDAIKSLKPDVKPFYIEPDGTVTYTATDASNPNDSQIAAEITRLHGVEAVRLLRKERDKRLAACDWRASGDLTLSTAWRTYRQQLRDLPASSTPTLTDRYELNKSSVTWPEEPKS